MRYIFCICLSFLVVRTFSQVTHFASLGPDLGLTVGKESGTQFGWGGSLQYQAKFSKRLGGQLHVGYDNFGNNAIAFLPLRAGLSWFIYQDLIFASADAGISHNYIPDSYPPTDINRNSFTWSVGIGYRYFIGNTQFMQLSAYYNRLTYSRYTNHNWLNIRVAFGLSFGKRKDIADLQ